MHGRKWTREQIVEQLQRYHRQGSCVRELWRLDRKLTSSAAAKFGSWRAALKAAGLESVRERWTRERVLNELRAQPCADASRRKSKNSKLVAAAVRYFGSMSEARQAAGLPTRPRRVCRNWTRERVLEALRSRQQNGLPLSTPKLGDFGLQSAAKRLFGSWRRALAELGLDTAEVKHFTREEVLKAIQGLYAKQMPHAAKPKAPGYLRRAARRIFGSWDAALQAAGLAHFRVHSWSKHRIAQCIRERQREGRPLNHVWRDDKPLFRAAVRYFGNWQGALAAAGVQNKPRCRWSREQVLEQLQQTYCGYECFRDLAPSLQGAINKYFTGWLDALEAAGLEAPPSRWTKQKIMAEIQQNYVTGVPLLFSKQKRLAYAAKRHFGSWEAAVVAAGLRKKLPRREPTPSWTADLVIESLQEQYRLHGQRMPSSGSNESLKHAARKHFGSWRSACLAAGLTPQRRRWCRESALREINKRRDSGLSLRSVVFKEDPPLAGAATRLFGSWRQAVEAAWCFCPPPDSELRNIPEESK